MATPAGKGEHHVYRIAPPAAPGAPRLTARQHYLGVDAVAWFIQKESSWFASRVASGTLEIALASGEQYQAALGAFALQGGARTAPVFEEPVLPDRNFLGGPIRLNATLTAMRSDTALATMLKSAAGASLGIIAGMVQTATAAGPAKLLSAAGGELVGGVKKVLAESGPKREPLFDFTGLRYAMRPEELTGDAVYLLFHRGAALDEARLGVRREGQLVVPVLGDAPLEDGAWLLLRLRRSDEYSGAREWYGALRTLRGRLEALVADVESGVVSKEDAQRQLRASGSGDATLLDELVRLRSVVYGDGVLTEREAGLVVGQLHAAVAAARKAIAAARAGEFDEALRRLQSALSTGRPLPGPVGSAFVRGFAGVSAARGREPSAPKPADLFASMTSMTRARRLLVHRRGPAPARPGRRR
ncbi:MAG TPA: hypothetical protein VFP65_15410 [Anaeromyxobacteraceae bacterium]|nr:hypothetical protein [Anaeromyxobacteraceae bacterium]